MSLTPREKLSKARIDVQKRNPFFSYLLMHLDLVEDNSLTEKMPVAVDNKGHLFYRSSFVEEHGIDVLSGVMIHEVLHLGLQHLVRRQGRNPKMWAIATDIAVNNIVIHERYHLTPNACTHRDWSGLSAEEIYEKLKKEGGDDDNDEDGEDGDDGDGDSDSSHGKRFDEHREGSPSDKDARNVAEDWKDRMKEAAEYSRSQGHELGKLGELVNGLFETKIDWRSLVWKFVSSHIMFDYTWTRPSKASSSLKIYLPGIYKQNLEMCFVIDTSGSISSDELKQFKSEVHSLARSYSNIDITIIEHTSDVTDVFQLTDSNVDEFLRKQTRYRGGTDHRPVFRWIEKNRPNTRGIVCLTDGYTYTPSSFTVPTIWVLTKDGSDSSIPFGEIVHIQ